MRPWVLIVAGVGLLGGCNHCQLRHQTLLQAKTLNDIQTEQVLDNIAHFVGDPEAVPTFAVPAGGVVNIQDNLNGGFFLNYTRVKFNQYQFNFAGAVTVTGNWSMAPVNDPDRLRLMRCLYQHVVGYTQPAGCPECFKCATRLKEFFGPNWEECNAPRGWYHCGKCIDVPLNACHVGHWGKTYVWVTPEGEEGLTRVTLSVLDIATALRIVTPHPSHEETRFYYDDQGRLIRQEKRNVASQREPGVEIVPTEPTPGPGQPDRVRDRQNFFDPTRGLFFVPPAPPPG